MNASFPFFSPPATLPTRPRRHIVDAGYFDNYGTLTAARWIVRNAETVDKLLKYPSDKTAEIVLLQIHCFAFESETKDWVRRDEKGRSRRETGGAALRCRSGDRALVFQRANMVYRGDERISGIKQLLDRNGIPMFERVLIECDISPSLNWVLTPDTRPAASRGRLGAVGKELRLRTTKAPGTWATVDKRACGRTRNNRVTSREASA